MFEMELCATKTNEGWLQTFLRLAQKTLMHSHKKIQQYQKEFTVVSSQVYKSKNFRLNEDQKGDSMRQSTMIRPNIQKHQIRLYDEIEQQVMQKQHPVYLLNQNFKQAFVRHYQQYVHKNVDQTSTSLLQKIIQKTIGLQSEYVMTISDEIEKQSNDLIQNDLTLQEQLEKKNEITLANQVIDDIKMFFASMHKFILMMYNMSIKKPDQIALLEDIAKLCLNLIIKDDVYKILICLVRIDNFEFDKDLREKYSQMKGVKSQDFGIDPYLTLSDPVVLIKELSKRFGIDIETTRDLLQNTSVQNQDLGEDLCSEQILDFKEFIKKNKLYIEKLPYEIRKIIIQKSEVKPYYKSRNTGMASLLIRIRYSQIEMKPQVLCFSLLLKLRSLT
eukprot:403336538